MIANSTVIVYVSEPTTSYLASLFAPSTIAAITALGISAVAIWQTRRQSELQLRAGPTADLLDALDEYRHQATNQLRRNDMLPHTGPLTRAHLDEMKENPAATAFQDLRRKARRWTVTIDQNRLHNTINTALWEIYALQLAADELQRTIPDAEFVTEADLQIEDYVGELSAIVVRTIRKKPRPKSLTKAICRIAAAARNLRESNPSEVN